MSIFKRILTALLAVSLLLVPFHVQALGAAQAGQLVLAAVTQDGAVIEPTHVSYEAGDSIRAALVRSGHRFDGIDGSYIYAIDGTVDNYFLFYDGNGYDLDAPADTARAVCFTSAPDSYSESYLSLLVTMAQYNGSTNGVKNYPAAQEAYRSALSGLYGADAQQAQALRDALQAQLDAYEAYLQGQTVPLRLAVTQNGTTLEAVDAVFTGTFGNVCRIEQRGTIDLIPDTYTFDVSDGGDNHIRGSVTVTGAQTLTLELPSGTWVKSIDLSVLGGEAWQAVAREGSVYYVPDWAAGNLFPYIVPSDGVNTTACGVFLADTPNAVRRTWQSKQTVLSGLITPNSMASAAFALEARQASGDYEQYQRYPVQIIRVPTLAALTVSADGAALPLTFDPTQTAYAVTTTSDRLLIEANALCADAVVTIDGVQRQTAELSIASGSSTPEIAVSHANGRSTVYTVQVTRVDAVEVTLAYAQGVTVRLTNAAGAQIAPKTSGDTAATYALVPNETYTYTTTKDTYYHTTADFTARSGLRVTAPTPDTADYLRSLHVGPTRQVAYPSDAAFSPAVHTYIYQVGSNQTAFGVLASLSDAAAGCTIVGQYADFRYWNPAYGARTLALTDGGYKSTTTFLGTSGEGNTMTLRIGTVRSGVAYYQDYLLTAQRLLQLDSLSVSDGETVLPLQRQDGKEGFDKAVLRYTVAVSQSQESLTANIRLFGSASGNDKACRVTVRCGETTKVLDYAALAVDEVQAVSLPLDPSLAEQAVSVRIEREGALTQEYLLTVEKLPPVRTEFSVTPANAVIFLSDDRTGARILPDADGVYTLNAACPYTYSITCYGYVSQQATFTAGQARISVTLQKAPARSYTELLQDGDWAQFRANAENNAITSAPTPIAAEEAVLNWANKLGDGLSGGGVGSPIIVGGAIYTYANDTVMKVDRQTGALLASAPMDHASSFSITPPAYGEGMIFVGLSGGGIQAFDAETLRSLWLYEDPLGGQPNCPITYRDGYLYTGFWNAETRKANFVCLSVTDEDPAQEKEQKIAAWSHTGNGFYWAGAYVAENYLIVTTDDGAIGYTEGHGEILSLDPRTGSVLDRMTARGVGDLRSSVCYDDRTGCCYFTSKGGDFYRVALSEDGKLLSQTLLHLTNGSDDPATPPMSTSTPVVYRGRAYVGVSGTSQFGAYSGHNITVIDLAAWRVAYAVPTQGYPQTSGLLTTAYEDASGYVYVYFIDNYTPGKLRVLRDKAGQTSADCLSTEHYTVSGREYTVQTAYTLFTPSGAQAQYAICSPITDAEGNLYFKNDSGYLMCVGSAVTGLTVTAQPEKTAYEVGQCFDPTGLRVTASYANGTTKDVTALLSYAREPLTATDTEFTLVLSLGAHQQMYQDRNGESGVSYRVPTATVDLTLYETHRWDDGVVTRAPTCTEAGQLRRTCLLCGAETLEAVPSLGGHDWDAGTTFAGVTRYTCLRCGATKTDAGKCDGGAQCPSRALADVSKDAWYHNEVDYAISHGLMYGTGATAFSPEEAMTRAQLVTVLWRQAGCPTPTGDDPFTDLAAPWYKTSVLWAAENGIVNGVGDGRFDPDGVLTREQLATILYRYAKDYLHRDVSARAAFDPFADGARVSSWAYEALRWAVAAKLIGGSSEDGALYLAPQAVATRAQVAAIFMRFLTAQ